LEGLKHYRFIFSILKNNGGRGGGRKHGGALSTVVTFSTINI